MDSYIYKGHRLTKTEEMLHAVFTSKAVLATVILSFTVFAGSVAAAINYFFLSQQLTLENAEEIGYLFPEFGIDGAEFYEAIYTAINFFGFAFLVCGAVYLWVAIGTVLIYSRAKNLSSEHSLSTGFTVLQSFGIAKLVAEGWAVLIWGLVGLGLLSSAETFIAGLIICFFIAVSFMYTLSIITFCSSVRRTVSGVIPAVSGTGTLQFSAFVSGLFTGIISILGFAVMIMAFINAEKENIPIESIMDFKRFIIRFIGITVIFLLMSVIHFLVFAIVRHYAKKIPLAANAERVYRQNMSNIYPEQYNPGQIYQSPENQNQTYRNDIYQTPAERYQAFMPPYDPNNDADDHSRFDNTQYPPYDPTQKY